MRKIIWNLATAAATAAVTAGVFMGLSVTDGYIEGRRKYREWTDKYTVTVGANETEGQAADGKNEADQEKEGGPETESFSLPADAPQRIKVDFENLKTANPDVVAWINLPAVEISYPVVQGDDNDYYLHRSLEKEYLFAGCLFLDAYNSPDFANYNSIIYGHNMRDGSMFAKLKNYNATETYESCPYFWIYTPEADYLYKIFSVHQASNGAKTFTVRFSSYEEYIAWIQRMKESSVLETDVDVKPGDKVVTLSTCLGDSSNKQVIQGVCVAAMDE